MIHWTSNFTRPNSKVPDPNHFSEIFWYDWQLCEFLLSAGGNSQQAHLQGEKNKHWAYATLRCSANEPAALTSFDVDVEKGSGVPYSSMGAPAPKRGKIGSDVSCGISLDRPSLCQSTVSHILTLGFVVKKLRNCLGSSLQNQRQDIFWPMHKSAGSDASREVENKPAFPSFWICWVHEPVFPPFGLCRMMSHSPCRGEPNILIVHIIEAFFQSPITLRRDVEKADEIWRSTSPHGLVDPSHHCPKFLLENSGGQPMY